MHPLSLFSFIAPHKCAGKVGQPVIVSDILSMKEKRHRWTGRKE